MSKKLEKNKYIITGGGGFLGSKVVAELKKRGVPTTNIFVPRSKDYDLRLVDTCKEVLTKGNILIHLAANVGGIGYNKKFPGQLFYDNAIMGLNLIEQARLANIEKVVTLGTVCAYPKFCPVPFNENDLWKGYPEETNAPYGIAKKILLIQSQAYREEYGMNAIYLLPVNLYGPGDNFNPQSSHVIPALIRKFVEGKKKSSAKVTVWGTGNATREFLYVEDAAQAIVDATIKYNKSEPVNIGSSDEISIFELAHLIAELVGYQGKIVFDTTKPDGQPKRKLDVSRAQTEFGFTSKTNFRTGLKKTINWYLENK